MQDTSGASYLLGARKGLSRPDGSCGGELELEPGRPRLAHSAQITTLLLRAQQRNSRSIDGTGIIPQFNVQGLALWPRDG